MSTFSEMQEAYDARLPDEDYFDPVVVEFENEVEFQENLIRSDVDLAVDALLRYLHEGDHDDDIANALYAVVDLAVNSPWANRFKPLNTIVNAATMWQAEQNAKKALK